MEKDILKNLVGDLLLEMAKEMDKNEDLSLEERAMGKLTITSCLINKVERNIILSKIADIDKNKKYDEDFKLIRDAAVPFIEALENLNKKFDAEKVDERD